MRTIGQRKERPTTFSASVTLMLEGARFNDEIHRLPTAGRSTFIPQGIFRFKSHAAANQHQQAHLIEDMLHIKQTMRDEDITDRTTLELALKTPRDNTKNS